MAKKRGDYRPVNFRAPARIYDLLAAVAESRGQDISAVINGVLADAAPGLRQWLLDREPGDADELSRRYLESLDEPHRGRVARLVAECVAGPDQAFAILDRWFRRNGDREVWSDARAILHIRGLRGDRTVPTRSRDEEETGPG